MDTLKTLDVDKYKKYKCKLLLNEDCNRYNSVKQLIAILKEFIHNHNHYGLLFIKQMGTTLINKLIKLYNKWHYNEIKTLLLELLKIIKENEEIFMFIDDKSIKEYFDSIVEMIKSSLRIEDE